MSHRPGARRPTRARLHTLEQARRRECPADDAPRERAEEEWVATFERLAAQGHFARELDNPRALWELEEAMAKESSFLPPADFLPHETDRERRLRWRRGKRFPAVDRPFEWLLRIAGRALGGEEPVVYGDAVLDEWDRLRAWLLENGERLEWEHVPGSLPEVTVSVGYLRYDVRQRDLRDGPDSHYDALACLRALHRCYAKEA